MLQYLDIAIGIGVVMLAVSLLITVLVQLVATILSLRGSNLRWAVTTLIGEVHPDLKEQAGAIASAVLTHPLVSDSTLSRFSKITGLRWLIQRVSLANAVRLEELIGVLDLLGHADDAQPAAGSTAAAPGTNASAKEAIASDASKTLAAAMRKIADAEKGKMGPQVQAMATQASELIAGLGTAAATASGQGWTSGTIDVDRLLSKVPGAADAVFGRDIKSWFNSTMDRATQRFTLQMRLVSVGLSLVVAFGLHLDAFQLFSDLSTRPELRASLVAQAGSMERLAGDVLANQKKPEPADSAKTPPPALPAPLCPAAHVPAVYTQAIVELQKGADKSRDPELANVAVPPNQTFADRRSATDWLRTQLIAQAGDGTKGRELSARLVPEYRSKVDCMLQSDTDKLLDRAAEIRGSLGQTSFQLIPDPYPFDVRLWRLREWFGILFSAALLGLGAPFWFNALKSMTALRPVLANKQEQEAKSAA